MYSIASQAIGEFLGTFLLIMSILSSGGNPLVIGATLALIVFLIGKISGGAVNPAVSLSLYLGGSISWGVFGLFVAVQILGAAAAVYTYNAVA